MSTELERAHTFVLHLYSEDGVENLSTLIQAVLAETEASPIEAEKEKD